VILKEVALRNWRSYRAAKFSFPAPRGNKKVLLVGAMNGFGKTSLLISLGLGLFGRDAMHFVEGVKLGTTEEETTRSYRNLMKLILHRPALQDDDPHASIGLIFSTDDDEAKGSVDIEVTRTWHFTKGGELRDPNGDGEEVRIAVAGKVLRLPGWREAAGKIADLILPAHVLGCFFFDGEQAQARVEGSGGGALNDAIRALYGTALLDDLNESLKSYISTVKSDAKRESGDVDVDELDLLRTKRNEKENKFDAIQTQVGAVRTELELAISVRKQRMTELTQITGDAAIDLPQLAQRRSELAAEIQSLEARVCDGMAMLALPVAMKRRSEAVMRRLEGEGVRDRWLLLREETLARVDSILERALPAAADPSITPPLEPQQHDQLAVRMRNALESLWSPPPPGCVEDYLFTFLTSSDRTAVTARLRSSAEAGSGSIESDVSDLASRKVTYRDVDRRWLAMTDVRPRVEEIRSRLNESDNKVQELQSRQASLDREAGALRHELSELAGSIGQREQRQRDLDPVRRKIDAAERVRSVIEKTREDLVRLCKISLESRCTEHFRAMISREFRNCRLEFDTDFQPRMVRPTGESIYVTTMSGAQRRAFGLAFTLAVADVTGEKAPIVIDTPVGNMDSEYRKRVLGYLAKAAPAQLIILSHDQEIFGEYVEELSSSILRKYLVKFEQVEEGAGVSTVTENTYFN